MWPSFSGLKDSFDGIRIYCMTQRLFAIAEGVAFNWLFTFAAGLLFGPVRGKPLGVVLMALVANILASTTAFLVTGFMHWHYGWAHLVWVVIGVWIANAYNIAAGHTNWTGWAVSLLPIALSMFLGRCLAAWLNPPNRT